MVRDAPWHQQVYVLTSPHQIFKCLLFRLIQIIWMTSQVWATKQEMATEVVQVHGVDECKRTFQQNRFSVTCLQFVIIFQLRAPSFTFFLF